MHFTTNQFIEYNYTFIFVIVGIWKKVFYFVIICGNIWIIGDNIRRGGNSDDKRNPKDRKPW